MFELYLYSPYGPYGLYRASVPVQGCTLILAFTFYFYISIVNPTRCSNFSDFLYLWDNTLHVSDGLSVHHQEFKTVHTATGIFQRGTAVYLLASRQQYLFEIYLLLYVQS